jgi:hypothetical protein
LHRDMLDLVQENSPMLAQIQPDRRLSATNLLHYLALRRHDVRALQDQLAVLGLSSLGRTETHVMSGVRAVMRVIASLQKLKPQHYPAAEPVCDGDEGRRLMERNAELLLGPQPEGRNVRIMVTMTFAAPYDKPYNHVILGDSRRFGDLVTKANLADIATYANGIGPWKPYIASFAGSSTTPITTSLIENAHAAGLFVHAYTFRNDSLPAQYQSKPANEYN